MHESLFKISNENVGVVCCVNMQLYNQFSSHDFPEVKSINNATLLTTDIISDVIIFLGLALNNV